MSATQNIVSHLRRIVGADGVLAADDDLSGFSGDEFADESFRRMPCAVVKPRTDDEVAAVAALCCQTTTPLTVRGGGTGLSGGCIPDPRGIVLSTERLTRIAVDKRNQTAVLGAGVSLEALYRETGAAGLFFPPHPGDESATIGGAVATNAGGARAVKYGTIRNFVLGLRAVMADGTKLEVGGGLRKSTNGYDLKDLLIGSEGTLAIITEVTVALLPPPGAVITVIAPFESVSDAIEAAPRVLEAGIVPMAVEFVQHETVRCSERLLSARWPASGGAASCMFIIDGDSEDHAYDRAERLAAVVEPLGCADVLVAESGEQQETVLRLRSTLYEALRPATAELLDVCVPRSEIAAHVSFLAGLEKQYRLPLPTYGHAADGNVHTHILHHRLVDGDIGAEIDGWRRLQPVVRAAIYRDAVGRGGVISGEHGIGLVKRGYLAEYLDAPSAALMRGIKAVFDPVGILNPGKIFLPADERRPAESA